MTHQTALNSLRACLATQRQILQTEAADEVERERLRHALATLTSQMEQLLVTAAEAVKGWPCLRTILVAVDGSEPSERAVRLASRLARELGACLLIAHVANTGLESAPGAALADIVERSALVERGKEILKHARALVPSDVPAEEVLLCGEPAKQLTQTARLHGADLIVIGTHARGRFARLLLGSTAEAVLRSAPCPVLTVGQEGDLSCPSDAKPPPAAAFQTA